MLNYSSFARTHSTNSLSFDFLNLAIDLNLKSKFKSIAPRLT